MPDSYYTEKLLGLQEVSIKKVNDMKEDYEIFIEQPRKQCVCPACGKVTVKFTITVRSASRSFPPSKSLSSLFYANAGTLIEKGIKLYRLR